MPTTTINISEAAYVSYHRIFHGIFDDAVYDCVVLSCGIHFSLLIVSEIRYSLVSNSSDV